MLAHAADMAGYAGTLQGEGYHEPSLAWLLQPLAVDTFLNEIWAKTHFHVERHCLGYFDDLLPGPSGVEKLLESFRTEP